MSKSLVSLSKLTTLLGQKAPALSSRGVGIERAFALTEGLGRRHLSIEITTHSGANKRSKKKQQRVPKKKDNTQDEQWAQRQEDELVA
ncbi:MAG: hypothetical protein OEQ39_24205 [Gammaproteobacteria bacterium]|nr:hypothetical protein [Gammaproteobacteria bacterium]